MLILSTPNGTFYEILSERSITNMKQRESKGLLAIWADIDADYRLTFEQWHNCEHINERVSIPGFYAGYRYESIDRELHHLMFYEIKDSKALGGSVYLHALNHPTPRTQDAIVHFRNPIRAIYTLLWSSGKKPPKVAPYISVSRFNIESGNDRETIKWFKEEYLPNITIIPGVNRGRLYEMDTEISNIKSEELKIHKAGLGEQRFLAIYEMESLKVATGKAWQEVKIGAVPLKKKLLQRLRDIHQELFWINFSMLAPETHPSKR